jgi:hypothetical protein
MTKYVPIPIAYWGRDHWSMLMYVETRIVDYDGKLSRAHIRSKTRTGWQPIHGTKLLSYDWTLAPPANLEAGNIRPDHDDYDCLKDMQAVGLLTQQGGRVQFTARGWALASRLRQWRGNGLTLKNFRYNVEVDDVETK